ncbi:hypothetical protein M2139_001719 [Enterococcus sp. PF1-24]|uniref:hypothetical protein n=1 Tax=unclassified Enterococcus TaxID=2608891 RepID=UPI002474C900|nr:MULTISPECIES: hypothetical protein [unclassified Enterococcus]MDH6364705.1 hypothetical protein [Enterococcus sp. PFB1-1]MDH6401819.1 hypothetical protein [Enterococcus sp. PF1-24]
MQRLKQYRGLLIAFTSGLVLSNHLSLGFKVSLVVPVALVLLMDFDSKKFESKILGGR